MNWIAERYTKFTDGAVMHVEIVAMFMHYADAALFCTACCDRGELVKLRPNR